MQQLLELAPGSRGVRPWRAECGLRVLYSQRQRSAKACASVTVVNSLALGISSLNQPLNDSAKPFCHGDPGSMYAVLMPLLTVQRLRAWAMNSGPLSLRINAGAG